MWQVNAKRIYRLYTEEGLVVRTRRRKERAQRQRVPLGLAVRPDQRWSMDFVAQRLADGRFDCGRIEFAYATDEEVIGAFQLCSRLEGIIPALESTHALVEGMKRAHALDRDRIVLVNLSGRGDKDVQEVARILGRHS